MTQPLPASCREAIGQLSSVHAVAPLLAKAVIDADGAWARTGGRVPGCHWVVPLHRGDGRASLHELDAHGSAVRTLRLG